VATEDGGAQGPRELRKDPARTAAVVGAARSGDQRALDELISAYLPLVYNVVGRALSGHADVDDVVQETMIRMVGGLRSLRDGNRFRSWLIAIAVREVRDKLHDRRSAADRTGPLETAGDVADPGADFADLTILRLGLSGQRRQVAEATRWLDQDDRELLALWWLEATGEIGRGELADAMGYSPAHAAVRIQRMRAQLETARAVVRALREPRCPELGPVLAGWDGAPGGRWRKRIARHLRDCVRCSGAWTGLIPPERLLAGLSLVPAPLLPALGLAAGGLVSSGSGAAVLGGWLAQSALAKSAAALVAGLVVAGTVATAVRFAADDDPPVIAVQSSRAAPARPAASPAAPSSGPVVGPSPSTVPYGSVVDAADVPPPRDRRPQPLPKRPEGTVTAVASNDNDPRPDVHSLIHRGESVTLAGRGYLRVEWQVPTQQRRGGIAPPAWSGLQGRLFHVASGGGHRMDDDIPGQAHPGLPQGMQQMWYLEYYYLDGQVTFTSRESGADYNLYVHIVGWQSVTDDVTSPPRTGGPLRYGLVRDPGTDACPVPQYLTRSADPAAAEQRSRV
jgi:RNA polymerase sigma factor (sigma-70 family)